MKLDVIRARAAEREREQAALSWTKPVLVEALRHVQAIRPPRVERQAKADLERIVRKVLAADAHDPVRVRLQQALADARATIAMGGK